MQGCVFLGTRSPQLHHPVLVSSFILVGIVDLFQLGLDELRFLEYSRPLLIYLCVPSSLGCSWKRIARPFVRSALANTNDFPKWLCYFPLFLVLGRQ